MGQYKKVTTKSDEHGPQKTHGRRRKLKASHGLFSDLHTNAMAYVCPNSDTHMHTHHKHTHHTYTHTHICIMYTHISHTYKHTSPMPTYTHIHIHKHIIHHTQHIYIDTHTYTHIHITHT